VTGKETWKHRAYKSVDSSRINVWKRELTSIQNRQAEALIGDRLIAYNYECSSHFEHYAKVYPSVDLMVNHRETLESFVKNGVRFWQGECEDQNKILVYVGEPDKDKWLRKRKPERWWDTFRIVLKIIISKLSNQPVYWLREQDARTDIGICSRVLAIVFQHTSENCFA
jgi:hypothetical protein